MGRVYVFALTAALNPALLAAVTLMLTLSKPKRLMAGYLLGAMLTSVTCGLVLVFALPSSSTSNTAKHSVDPVVNIVLGALLLLMAAAVATGRDKRRQAWSAHRREKAKDKAPPKWRTLLSKGSARDTFVVGMLLSFPGASYIAGMDRLHDQHISVGETVIAVLLFNVIMLMLLEIPLIGYATRPESTAVRVQRLSAGLGAHGGRIALIAAIAFGLILVGRGIVNW